MLADLTERGFAIAVATNKPSRFTVAALDALGLGATFGGVASADECPAKKPAPDVIRLALTRAGQPKDPRSVLYVGDMPVDVEAARNFGCAVIGVEWGFAPAALRAARPDVLVDHPAGVVDCASSGLKKE